MLVRQQETLSIYKASLRDLKKALRKLTNSREAQPKQRVSANQTILRKKFWIVFYRVI